jgi:dTDP-4-amino-4,6-dideoxygalactose transaminase
MNWPHYSNQEIKKVIEVIKSGKVNYWTGSEVKNFEKEFSNYFGNKYSIAICNASLGLEAALLALNIGKGDEVITTSRSYNSSASCILKVGASPVFLDIDLNTQNLSLTDLKKKISKNTKAIICVHLGGTPCDMVALKKIVKGKKVKIIEDCSQAHGAKFDNRYVGTFSDISIWSFCNDKIISTLGEGGMISTNQKNLYLKLWSLKEIGKDFKKTNTKFLPKFKWTHDNVGTNLRMTEVQAAVGRIQLKNLNQMVLKRRKLGEHLQNFFLKNDLFYTNNLNSKYYSSYYKFYFFLKKKDYKKRSKIITYLRKKGHDVSVGSCPEIYLEKPFQKFFKKKFRLKNAKIIGEKSIALTLSHLTTKKEINKFCSDINIIKQKLSFKK